jgi:hypothetical protein
MHDVEQLILTELHNLQVRMDARFDSQDKEIADQGKLIAQFNAQMKSLIGNGQPGIVQKMEDRITSLETQRNLWLGKQSVIGGIAAALISLAIATQSHWMPFFSHR